MTCEEYKSITKWSGRIAKNTYETYLIAFNQFMRWLKVNGGEFADMSPDELIEYQKNTDNGTIYEILDRVQNWSQSLHTPDGVEWRLNSKKAAYSAIRSFFAHNRAPLPRDPYNFRSGTPESEGTLTIENIRDAALASKRVYRAVFISMFQAGLDLQGFVRWNLTGWKDLENDLGDPRVEIIKIKLPFRKMNRKPFHTYIGGDAIKAIRDYVGTRPTEDEARAKHEADEERRRAHAKEKGVGFEPRPFHYAIFYSMFKTPLKKGTLQMYWLARLEGLGLITRTPGTGQQRYGKNLHEMRDVWRSQWEKSPAKASVAEFCMGHKVDPLEYNKAYKDEEWVRDVYEDALPMLQIMSSGIPYGKIDGKVVKTMQKKISDLESQLAAAQDEAGKVDRLEKQMEKNRRMIQRMLDMEKRLDDKITEQL